MPDSLNHEGHGPIRYFVKSYEPEKGIYFEFTGPSGFNGYHGFDIGSIKMKGTVL